MEHVIGAFIDPLRNHRCHPFSTRHSADRIKQTSPSRFWTGVMFTPKSGVLSRATPADVPVEAAGCSDTVSGTYRLDGERVLRDDGIGVTG